MEVNETTSRIIGAAIDVHRELGPGLLEWIYESALCIEFDRRGVRYQRQVEFPAVYKGEPLGLRQRIDLIVEGVVVVEVKAVERMNDVFTAQAISYLKLTGLKVGLIINFNEPTLIRGVKRVVLEFREPVLTRP